MNEALRTFVEFTQYWKRHYSNKQWRQRYQLTRQKTNPICSTYPQMCSIQLTDFTWSFLTGKWGNFKRLQQKHAIQISRITVNAANTR